ncbi:MAG: ABC transporter substrate-binding protein, partial [Pseudomonadota bacterium]
MRLLILVAAFTTLALPATAQETRIFADDLGREVEIPVDPQRVASLYAEQFTTALYELGAPVVGSSGRTADGVNGGAPYIRGALTVFDLTFEDSGIAYLGDWRAPDLEVVAAVQPDLIVISEFTADSLDQLSAIAPTVVVNFRDTPWLERYERLADASGRLPEFERRLGVYQRRLEAGRIVVEDAVGNP